MAATTLALPLRIGTRTLGRVRRRLVRVAVPLEEAQAGKPPGLPPLGAADGWLVTGLAEGAPPPAGMLAVVRQRYRRHFAALDGGWEAWLAGLSGRTRSTLRRKVRRFAEASGGRLEIRCYRSPGEVEDYHRLARALSARTYQERRLSAGLPDGAEALAEMRRLAAADRLRAFILFMEGRPAAYLHLPAEGGVLRYAHLGYDPDLAALSPGTVLHFEALRLLMEEGRFALLDFTEGEGRHKETFATGSVPCVDLLLLRPTLPNRLAAALLAAFDGAVAAAKRLTPEKLARALRR